MVSSEYAKAGDKPMFLLLRLTLEKNRFIGARGSGNIFFGNANLRGCDYCQNFFISQSPKAEIKNEVSIERLSDIMIELQNMNCHNIGLVSPTHFRRSDS